MQSKHSSIKEPLKKAENKMRERNSNEPHTLKRKIQTKKKENPPEKKNLSINCGTEKKKKWQNQNELISPLLIGKTDNTSPINKTSILKTPLSDQKCRCACRHTCSLGQVAGQCCCRHCRTCSYGAWQGITRFSPSFHNAQTKYIHTSSQSSRAIARHPPCVASRLTRAVSADSPEYKSKKSSLCRLDADGEQNSYE